VQLKLAGQVFSGTPVLAGQVVVTLFFFNETIRTSPPFCKKRQQQIIMKSTLSWQEKY
jgi:hypothetical protein